MSRTTDKIANLHKRIRHQETQKKKIFAEGEQLRENVRTAFQWWKKTNDVGAEAINKLMLEVDRLTRKPIKFSEWCALCPLGIVRWLGRWTVLKKYGTLEFEKQRAAHQFTIDKWHVLCVLGGEEKLSGQELALKLGIPHQRVATVLSELEKENKEKETAK